MGQTVRKWNHGRKTHRPAVGGYDDRDFVPKDMVIYTIMYLFPPLIYVVNKFADYPLSFGNRIPGFVGLSAVLISVIFFNMLAPGSMICGFERFGPFILYVFRAVSVSYLEAVNKPGEANKELAHYPVLTVHGEKSTGAEWLESIQKDSRFSSHISWTAKRTLHTSVLSIILAAGLAIVAPVQRVVEHGSLFAAFGEGFFEAIAIMISAATMCVVTAVLLRAFFQSFAFYRSMTSAMRRFKNSTVGSFNSSPTLLTSQSAEEVILTAEEKVVEAEEETSTLGQAEDTVTAADDVGAVESTSRARKAKEAAARAASKLLAKKSHKRKVKKPAMTVDITVPDNLRAWMNVHDALHSRRNSLEATMVTIAAAGTLALLALAGFAILFGSFLKGSTQVVTDDGAVVHVAGALSSGSAAAVMYVVIVVGGSLIVLTWVGDAYNYSSKRMLTQHLYQVQLHASLDLHCEASAAQLSEKRLAQLKTSTSLIPVVRSHIEGHVHELGLFNFSYSQLFLMISTLVPGLLSKYLFKLF